MICEISASLAMYDGQSSRGKLFKPFCGGGHWWAMGRDGLSIQQAAVVSVSRGGDPTHPRAHPQLFLGGEEKKTRLAPGLLWQMSSG
ncbi:hypothetical protein IF1G_06677 [Cordyceps javanica]|uniref:Uncharacterized protein n=1 Tax=Cordyceps javanica TaxID=43265 RepID=A0A545UYZ1_9HYPO|nr:hypothetical protein IF1G_06677 [Cordyceps javanica]